MLQISTFIFNCLRKNTPSNFERWFKLNHSVHSHRTRSNFNDVVNLEYSNNLHILYARISFYGLKLIKVFGPKFWNSIPFHIRSAVNIKHFSKVLKLYLVNIIEWFHSCIIYYYYYFFYFLAFSVNDHFNNSQQFSIIHY